MSYRSGSHTVFHHRYHIVWITKYRYNVLEGALRERIRTMIRQVCKGRHFWGRGYFSTTSGNITDDVILQYLREHEPTGAGR